ncbi:MAG: hypothetical protein DME47_06930 [Verrucomicrobia bacterium]|nr:MAG: hypothetical protein DME47_06930 [Verrucomicrobiota bacterium]
MIYHFSLQMAALFAGAILCLLGAFGFAMESSARDILAAFPRSRGAGIVLLSIDLVWSFWLVSTMEMGEFSAFRRPFLIILPIGFFLTLRFVDEFLAVRALGIQIARSNRLVQQNNCTLAWRNRVRFCLWRDLNRSSIPLLLNEFSSFVAGRLAISF